MRAVIQRVLETSVKVEGEIIASINKGLLVFVGVENTDTQEDIIWLSAKIAKMRIFSDENGLMNKSVIDTQGEIVLVSQFTLFANTKKGNRPSFTDSAKPKIAIPIYKDLIKQLEVDLGKSIQKGEFGADMKISLINDGPVTICIDTKNRG
jgi:D-tyrosyl-tRNA(Tyr) deacylase